MFILHESQSLLMTCLWASQRQGCFSDRLQESKVWARKKLASLLHTMYFLCIFFLQALVALLRLVPQRPKIICFKTFVLCKYWPIVLYKYLKSSLELSTNICTNIKSYFIRDVKYRHMQMMYFGTIEYYIHTNSLVS